MRRRIAILTVVPCLLALGLLPATAGAAKGEFEVSPTVGFTLPLSGDLLDGVNAGPAFGAQGIYYFQPDLGAGASIIYNALGTDADNVDFSITEIHAMLKKLFPGGGSVTPYGKAVLGLFSNSSSIEVSGFGSASGSSTDFGLGAGGGVQSRVNETWGWFGEAMVMLDDFSEIYLGIRAGANIYFGNPQ